MTKMAENLATTKAKNSTATPVAAGSLNKSVTSKASTPSTNATDNMESKMQQSAGNVPSTPTLEACSKAVKESNDLVSAIECVAGMFGIPSENIVCDDTLDDIKVQGDTIIAPSISSQGKESAIMRSISAVLDYIAQRIDAKLNNFQTDNINRGVIIDHVSNVSDPAKGKVINRHITPEGDEVLVYDSGLIDIPNTDSARAFANVLRANGSIPTPMLDKPHSGVQYFTDDDDITNNVDISKQGASNYGDSEAGLKTDNANQDSNIPTPIPVGTEINMADTIDESYAMMNLVSKYGNTKHLGYEMMTEMGYNCIEPINYLFESGDNKNAHPSDIKHMKFDNTHIMKAVKLFNTIRAEQKDVDSKNVDIAKMVNSPNWHNAIKEIEQQFDCHLVIHYLKDGSKQTDASSGVFSIGNEYRQNVTVSKSKGFQLNGLPITVYLLNDVLSENAPTDPSLFGQAVTAIILHEIFHNVMMVFREYNNEFNAMMSTTMIAASLTNDAKVRRELITNFANAVDAMNPPGEKMNIIEKKAYIKKLLIICSLKESKENMRLAQSLVEEDDNTDIDRYLKLAEEYQAKQEKKLNSAGLTVSSILGCALGASMFITGMANPTFWLVATGGMLTAGSYLRLKVGRAIRKQMREDVKSRERGDIKDYEEHWADMFASMYNLPVNFFLLPHSKVVAANMTDEQIKRLHKIEMNWVNLMGDEHPPTMERLAASVKYAKQTLESGAKINPEVKKYLEWIIANHSRILEVEDIDNLYSKATFDPKTAEDIDLHIANLISKTNTNITEQST
jgi:hypothetical protein